LQQDIITPYTWTRTGALNASFTVSRKSASGSTSSRHWTRHDALLVTGFSGTISNARIRRWAIRARPGTVGTINSGGLFQGSASGASAGG
jgi:hypothetical protein